MSTSLDDMIINPQLTDPTITPVHRPLLQSIHDGHYVVAPAAGTALGRLLVLFPGTNAPGRNLKAWADHAAGLGYHAIAVEYVNTVLIANLQQIQGQDLFGAMRKVCMEGGSIVLPTTVKTTYTVAPPDGVMNRLTKIVAWMAAQYPAAGWSAFWLAGAVNWSLVSAMGHSQGSGIAIALGKLYALNRVIIVGGPQDWRDDVSQPAAWLSDPGATPANRQFAFLGVHDEFDINKQLPCDAVLINAGLNGIFVTVTSAPPAGANPQVLITIHTLPMEDVAHLLPGVTKLLPKSLKEVPWNHESLIRPVFADLWTYLLTAPVAAPRAA